MSPRDSLIKGIKAGLRHLTFDDAVSLRKSISISHWAKTYSVSAKTVRDEWESALTDLPPNIVTGESE